MTDNDVDVRQWWLVSTAGQKHRICVCLISTRNQELELSVWLVLCGCWLLVDGIQDPRSILLPAKGPLGVDVIAILGKNSNKSKFEFRFEVNRFERVI
jgi:hypothetical protein